MQILENNLKDISQNLVEELRRLPHLRIMAVKGEDPDGADLEVRLQFEGRGVRLIAEVKQRVYPRDIPAIVHQLQRLTPPSKIPTVPMVIATAISDSTRQALRERDIGYWDTSGSLYMPLPGGLYFIDKPVPKGDERRLTNVFRGSTAQVVHVLLNKLQETWSIDHHNSWHVQQLAKQAMVSPSTVHQALEALEAEGWLEKHGRGPEAVRQVIQPGAMLDAWAASQTGRSEPVHRFYILATGGDAVEEKVIEALLKLHVDGFVWAVTGPTAAQHRAPFLSHVPVVTVRTSQNLPIQILESIGFRPRPVDEGENIVVIQTKELSPFLGREKGIQEYGFPMVSDVQLYLDLWTSPMRGKEQAKHLRQVRLPF